MGVAIGNFVLDLSEAKHLFNGPVLSSKQCVFDEVSIDYDSLLITSYFDKFIIVRGFIIVLICLYKKCKK